MLQTALKLYGLFEARERRRLYGVIAAMLAVAVFDMAGVFSIMPFMALVANPGAVHGIPAMEKLYVLLGAHSPRDFLMTAGLVTLLLITASNAIGALSTRLMLRFSYRQEHLLSRRLLRAYLHRPYVFYLTRNTAELWKNVFSEVTDVVHGMLIPGMQALARACVTLAVLALLVAVRPLLALTISAVLAVAFLAVFGIFRAPLARAGVKYREAQAQRFKSASEALGGIKEIKLYGQEAAFLARYDRASEGVATAAATSHIVSQLPRYALEVVAFGGIVLLVLYLLSTAGSLDQVLPLLTLYALAGYRLMPALQQVFAAAGYMRFHAKSLDALSDDLRDDAGADPLNAPRVPLQQVLKLEGISFAYEGKEPLLDGVTLEIPARHTVAFVGPTGSGKTTLVDLIMGLLTPQRGRLLADGAPIGPSNLAGWQRNFGYVPQNIYLVDDSIAANIALGVEAAAIDMARVRHAARMASLDGFIESELTQGYDTPVGERGVRLSGGQRQRIGIARALYNDPPVLVFDEATSALDGATEAEVMQAITGLAGTKTLILIAHRLSSVRACDRVYLIAGGKVADSGSYRELFDNNPTFRNMALMQDTSA
jgi:ABC-type multidrug transport system fused ATPase/permease subunit